MRASKLCMGVINNQDFGLTSEMVNSLLMGWDTECRMEVMRQKK